LTDVLARICADKRIEIERRKGAVPPAAIERQARDAPPPRGFSERLCQVAGSGRTALIAEIKKASPSKGLIRSDFDPTVLARIYADAGAACLSVLTDGPYFQGSDTDLVAARAAVDLPVLRKDFILDPYQVFETRAIGADCMLLIMAAVDDATASTLVQLARELNLDVLIEVHDETEFERARHLDTVLIGINNRDLKTLKVDLAVFERVAPRIPLARLKIAESGVATRADIRRLKRAGAHAFLVGESLMREADVGAATRELLTYEAPGLEAEARLG
jgi:indole-3-glycerol phosphate synthase